MNHDFSPRRLMTDKEMLKRKDYVVQITSNEGKQKQYVSDCYRNALTKAMHSMNPNVHMITIQEVEGMILQRWDRVREVDGNEWEECDVDDLITLGRIVESINVGTVGNDGDFIASAHPHNAADHHWWSLLSHMKRYGDFLINDKSDDNWANNHLYKQLSKEMAVVEIFAEICDHKEQQQQTTKFPFLKSGKNSKVTLPVMSEYLNADYSDDPELKALILKLKKAVEDVCDEAKASEYFKNHNFDISWKSIRWHWQDLTAF